MARSRSQETRAAKASGGQQVHRSGAGWRRKHDVRDDVALWEMKRTDKASIAIKAKDLESVRSQAILDGRIPVLGIELAGRNWVLIEEADYLAFVEAQRRTERDAQERAAPAPLGASPRPAQGPGA